MLAQEEAILSGPTAMISSEQPVLLSVAAAERADTKYARIR
jgi:hypothetical protein